MKSKDQITFKVTLNLDENWASHSNEDELVKYLKERLNSSLGFRGQVERFSVVDKNGKGKRV
jgi:hypothetical protein